jgi:hypothetical protein
MTNNVEIARQIAQRKEGFRFFMIKSFNRIVGDSLPVTDPQDFSNFKSVKGLRGRTEARKRPSRGDRAEGTNLQQGILGPGRIAKFRDKDVNPKRAITFTPTFCGSYLDHLGPL